MAISKNDGLGYGQTWQNLTGVRVVGVTYINTTGKPKQVMFCFSTNNNIVYGVTVDGVLMGRMGSTGNGIEHSISVVIPPNASYIYSVTALGGEKIFELI